MRPTEHGEVWEARVDKLRPVVVASRDDVHGRRSKTTVATVTSVVRGLPTEVPLDHRDGMARASVVNCDELHSIDKRFLLRRLGRLTETKIAALDDALRFALQLK